MSSRFVVTVFSAALATGVLSAQQRPPQGMTGAQETALPVVGAPLTIAEQFVGQLRIDIKSQGAAVDEILIGATKEAAPIAQDILQVRQKMVNAALRNEADIMKTLLAEYATAATKMVTVESQAFMKVYGILKPNQQSRAPEAFTIMAGIFLPTPPPARRPAQGPRPTGGGR